MTGLYFDVVCYSVMYTYIHDIHCIVYNIHIYYFFSSNLNLSRNKRTTVEISVLILSCVILGLNPVLPVLHIYILLLFFYS